MPGSSDAAAKKALTGSGRPYSVFTPYRNAWLKALEPRHLAPHPVAPRPGAPGARKRKMPAK